MSLPPKLLERLKKRGIIQQTNESESKRSCDTEYKKQSNVIGCPNKYNVFHDCSTYCELKYGLGMESPSPRIKQIYETLIENYPLDENWKSIWEPGCWYPPDHPKFRPTKSANTLRAERGKTLTMKADNSKSSEQSDKINKELNQFDTELNNELKGKNLGEQSNLRTEEPYQESSIKQFDESNIKHDEEEQSDESYSSGENSDNQSSDENRSN